MKSNEQEISLKKAINCLVYGVNCCIYDQQTKKIYQCSLNIHQQYINILHIIVNKQASYLIQLQQLKTILDQDPYISKKLAKFKAQHFMILYTHSISNIILVFHTNYQKQVVWLALLFFCSQATIFYRRISQLDPFKAQAAMLFLSADKDGGNLLDIKQIMQIFKIQRITKSQQQIEYNIIQINTHLYQKDNLKKPSGFNKQQLTPLGFQYLLRYLSIKYQVSNKFTYYCPLFKMKKKNIKNSIMDILRNNQKPLMSNYQLQNFYKNQLGQQIQLEYALTVIKSFPRYDGQGKQKKQQCHLLSFNNFCNILFSKNNDLMDPQKLNLYNNMNLPLNDYYIYSSNHTYLSGDKEQSKLQMIQFAFKKGSKCLSINIQLTSDNKIGVGKKNILLLEDVLKSIKMLGFENNPYPVLLLLESISQNVSIKSLIALFDEILGDLIYIQSSQINDILPSPQSLKNKIIIFGFLDDKNQKQLELLGNKISFIKSKVDFQRKNQTCWNFCSIDYRKFIEYQNVEQSNLQIYTRKIMIRTHNDDQGKNYNPISMFRMGAQLISISFQNPDQHHFFVHSRFLENKSCGYIAKPPWMCVGHAQGRTTKEFQTPLYQINLEILSGQKCLIQQSNSQTFYLQVYLKGTKLQQSLNKLEKSVLKKQGFYTDFSLNCKFTIYCPDIATIVMNITDGIKILAYRAIRVGAIRQGIRCVSLLSQQMKYGINSYLLVDCRKKQFNKNKKFDIMMLEK